MGPVSVEEEIATMICCICCIVVRPCSYILILGFSCVANSQHPVSALGIQLFMLFKWHIGAYNVKFLLFGSWRFLNVAPLTVRAPMTRSVATATGIFIAPAFVLSLSHIKPANTVHQPNETSHRHPACASMFLSSAWTSRMEDVP